jgi:tripartite-type tricarboxylate transporter receptor subunit TctC
VPVKSVPELIAFAKKQPGGLTHASGGSATLLALELLKAMTSTNILSIPYHGGAPAVAAAIAGETSMIVADLATGSAGLQSDRIRPLAVTSMTRSKKYPELPTLNESSVTGYEVNTWMGFFTPTRTPDAVANQIEAAIKEVLTLPDVRARLEQTGMRCAAAPLRSCINYSRATLRSGRSS